MSDTQVIFGFLFLAVMLGGMWSSYKIGFKEGTGKMIDFCKTKADRRGYTLIYFFGNNIEFIDPLSYNKNVLDAIADAIEEKDDSSS